MKVQSVGPNLKFVGALNVPDALLVGADVFCGGGSQTVNGGAAVVHGAFGLIFTIGSSRSGPPAPGDGAVALAALAEFGKSAGYFATAAGHAGMGLTAVAAGTVVELLTAARSDR